VVEPTVEAVTSTETHADPTAGHAETSTAEPPPINHQTMDAYAKRLHGEFKGVFVAELKKMNAKFGVSKLSDVPADKLPEAYVSLKLIERALNEGL
jgi:hypothetical protein